MTEQGFQLEGFLRSLQPQLGGFFLFLFSTLIVYLIVYLILRAFFIRSLISRSDQQNAVRVLNWGVGIIIAILLISTAVTTISRMGANRLPRNDVDKSGVYEQMESHRNSQNP